MSRKKVIMVVILIALVFGFFSCWLIRVDFEHVAKRELLEKYPDRGIPRIDISLNDVNLDTIKNGSKEIKYEGNKLALIDKGDIYEYDEVEIKGRGNSTWVQEKKPYQIKFKNGIELLGMGKNKKWIFLANYLDASSIRNDVAMILAEMLGEEYNTRGKYVELYFDGKYEGLYYVLPRIEISKGSVDLRGKDGVLFELDSLRGEEYECYYSYLNDCLVLKDVVTNNEEEKQLMAESFLEDFDELEVAVINKDFEKVVELVDVESFAKYFLVNEFTVNPDAYAASFFLYKDGEDDRIHAGPVWDFDYALANRNWSSTIYEDFYSPYEDMVRKKEIFASEERKVSKLFYYMIEMPEFYDEVKRVFKEKMSGRKEEFKREIMARVEKIEYVIKEDNEKWRNGNYKEEIDKLVEWISVRYDFFEELYGEKNENVELF